MALFEKKYVYVNKQEYQASVKQVSGFLQLGELKVSAEDEEILALKLKKSLSSIFEVLNDFNQVIESEKAKKEAEKEKITLKRKKTSKKEKKDGEKAN